jgi:carbon-monoxide dehydrogenase small subunit
MSRDARTSGPARLITLKVNGDHHEVAVEPWRTLNEVLREELGLTGTKHGCGQGDCGACTVLLDGRSVLSCLTLAVSADGCDVRTVEGLAQGRERLHPIQEAFISGGAIQCGYCTPGMELSALYLLQRNPRPTETDIRAGLAGNLCRCTGYAKIVAAIAAASTRLPEGTG